MWSGVKSLYSERMKSVTVILSCIFNDCECNYEQSLLSSLKLDEYGGYRTSSSRELIPLNSSFSMYSCPLTK